MLLADMDAVVLSACGLLVAAGILLHVWAGSGGSHEAPLGQGGRQARGQPR